MVKKQKLAIFDIDGTIFRSSLLIEFTDAMLEEGIFPQKVAKLYGDAYRHWLDRKGPYDDYIMAVVKVFDTYIKGVPYKVYREVAKKVVAFHKNRVYRYTRDLVRELRERNYYLIVISHSSQEIVTEFAKTLGFKKVYARIHEVDGRGKLTGKAVNGEQLADKSNMLKMAVEENGLTLDGSIGVGDTENDIPFLKMVDHPICFNPNSKLYDYAKKAGWQIVVERKDVVYHL